MNKSSKIGLLALAMLAVGVFTGCEHEHWEHHHRGGPGPGYEYGRGPYYQQGVPYEYHRDADDYRR